MTYNTATPMAPMTPPAPLVTKTTQPLKYYGSDKGNDHGQDIYCGGGDGSGYDNRD